MFCSPHRFSIRLSIDPYLGHKALTLRDIRERDVGQRVSVILRPTERTRQRAGTVQRSSSAARLTAAPLMARSNSLRAALLRTNVLAISHYGP